MAAAFVVSVAMQLYFGYSSADPRGFAIIMLVTVGVSTVVWLLATFLTPPEPDERLISFYRRVRPPGPLWKPVACKAPDVRPSRDLKYNFLDWVAGCVLIYGALFGVGKLILKDFGLGFGFLCLAAIAGAIIYRDLSVRGWKTITE